METLLATTRYDVLGIGNAIVDVIAHADEAFLTTHDMPKGSMSLIDEDRAEAIYQAMGAGVQVSGGSAGNTIAGVGSLGGTAAYIGKVKDDVLGGIYRHDMRGIGVTFDTPAATDGPATARCLILVTSDAQRTMNTYLGACVNLGPDDIDEAIVADAAIVYLEGYLFDKDLAKAAFRKAAAAAHKAGRKVSLSLSDSFCVDRHRDDFLALIDKDIDILFANESEITALYQTDDVDAAAAKVAGSVEIAAITLGAEGCLIVGGGQTIRVPAAKANQVVDTTGAGDLFAAGFLYGVARGLPLAECGRLAGIAAAEVISHFGPRPETPLNTLI
jgi:sugar/nucleoside kinase (ribokinase family)